MLTNPKAYLASTETIVETVLEKRQAQKQLDKLTLPFIELLVKIDKKVEQLKKEGYPNKAAIAATLHTKLNAEFELYQASQKNSDI